MGTLVYKASIHLDQREFPTLQRRDSYSEMLRLFLQIRTRSLPPRNPFSAVFKPRRRTSTSSSASSTPPSTPSASPTTSPVMAPSQGDPALANIPRNTNRRPLSGVSRGACCSSSQTKVPDLTISPAQRTGTMTLISALMTNDETTRHADTHTTRATPAWRTSSHHSPVWPLRLQVSSRTGTTSS
jgi:hypothetical protein